MPMSDIAPNPRIAATALALGQHIMSRSFGEGAIPTGRLSENLPGRPLTHPSSKTLTHGAQGPLTCINQVIAYLIDCAHWTLTLTPSRQFTGKSKRPLAGQRPIKT